MSKLNTIMHKLINIKISYNKLHSSKCNFEINYKIFVYRRPNIS